MMDEECLENITAALERRERKSFIYVSDDDGSASETIGRCDAWAIPGLEALRSHFNEQLGVDVCASRHILGWICPTFGFVRIM